MCLSVLAYQEVARRIEELTGAIYALDPYFVMPATDEHAATLSMLASSAAHARSHRARSPARRTRAHLAAPAAPGPARARSPCWAPGGITYAEIVKGSGSRSSSRGSRAPEDLAPPDEVEVPAETCVLSERVDDDAVSRSDTRVSESISVSEPYGGDVIVYYDEFVPRAEPVSEYYTESPMEYREMPIDVPAPVYQESPEPLKKLPDQPMRELQPEDFEILERAMSPSPKQRSHELSYAEILALGLRKQPRTHSVTSLPKPQVAHVELVKEIVVECVERSPSIQQYESKVERIEPPRFKPDRPERQEKTGRLEKPERPERPPARSRSREMPRQRRGPEKRPTKAHDVQALKKKKTVKKVIEVQDFDEPEQLVEVELTPIRETLVKAATDPTVEIGYKEVTKKLQHSATVVETVTELVAEESESETVEEVEQKKPKKKQKPKKPKSPEDEILQALKEIEELERKKKKSKEPRDKSKDSITEVITVETLKEPEGIELKKHSKEALTDAHIKSKKKKGHKESPVKSTDVNTEFITVESTAPVELVTKENKPKKKKNQKQASLDKPEKSERSSVGSITDVISVLDSGKSTEIPVETKSVESNVISHVTEFITLPEVNEEKQQVWSIDDQSKVNVIQILDETQKNSTTEVISTITSNITDHVEYKEIFETVTEPTVKSTCEKSVEYESKSLLNETVIEPAIGTTQEKEHSPEKIQETSIATDTVTSVTETIDTQEKQNIEQATEAKESELFSIHEHTLKQVEQIDKKVSKNKKKKGKAPADADIVSTLISKESEQTEQEQKPTETVQLKIQPETEQASEQPEILKLELSEVEQTQSEQIEILPEQPEQVQPEHIEIVPVQPEQIQLDFSLHSLTQETIQSNEEEEVQLELHNQETFQEESVPQEPEQLQQPELKSAQPELVQLEPIQEDLKTNEVSSKHKKKKKQKKHEKTPEPVVFEAKETVEVIEEEVKTTLIEPVVAEIPNLVEQVEEPKPTKKKKSKKGKHVEVKKDTIGKMEVEHKEIEQPTAMIKSNPKETEVLQHLEETKRAKKRSKPKPTPENVIKEIPVETLAELVQPAPEPEPVLEEIKLEEPAFEEVKSHKKRKSKKLKIDDDDIEKALKEIERTEGFKKKPKERTPKPKTKQEQPKSVITTSKVAEHEIQKEVSSMKVEYDTSPEEDIENVQPIKHIDWNTMLEEEEGVAETTLEPMSKPESVSAKTGTEHVANQVTILKELKSSIEGAVLTEKSTNNISENSKDVKVTPVTSPANEQNNNDKFFSPDVFKEGSYNIVEEITHYEPITQDVETRTIYLITHEEKKLPPIRTVKVFSSKSNSLEEPQTSEENVVLNEETINNKITDEKSSNNVSDNVLDGKKITERFIDQEKISDSESRIEKAGVKSENTKTEYVQENVKTSDFLGNNTITSLTSTSSVLITTQTVANVVTEVTTTETVEKSIDEEVQFEKIETSKPTVLEEIDTNNPEKQLTEEDFSDIIEEAIFGSVQDRNRTPAEKRNKEKYSNIPYQELINVDKTYSENMDTYKLDYDYSQLMLSQRDSQVSQAGDVILGQETTLPVQSIESIESVSKVKPEKVSSPVREVPPKESYQDVKDGEGRKATQITEIPTVVNVAIPTNPTSRDVLQEVLLKTFVEDTTSKTDTQQTVDFISSECYVLKPLDEVDASILNNATIVEANVIFDTDQLSLGSQREVLDEKPVDIKPTTIDKSTEGTKPSLVSSVNEETPRISYHEIKDAEMILASKVSNEMAVTTDVETVSSLRVSEAVSKTESTSQVRSVSEDPEPVTEIEEIVVKVEHTNRKSPLKEEAPRISYHEIRDAEIMYASQVKSKEESKTTNLEHGKPEATPDIHVEVPKTEEVKQTVDTKVVQVEGKSKQVSVQDILLQALDKTSSTTSIKTVTEHTVDIITAESMVLKSNMVTEKEPVNADRKPSEVEKRPLSHEETPRHSYHEIVDAEKRLAHSKSEQSVVEEHIFENLAEDKAPAIAGIATEVTTATVVETPKEILPELAREVPTVSYQEISDAEKRLATKIETSVTVTKDVTKTLAKETVSSESDIQSTVPVETDKELEPKIFETPRVGYHEISDAEYRLAIIVTTSRESSKEPSPPKEVDEKQKPVIVEDVQNIPDVHLTTEPIPETEQKIGNHVSQNDIPISNGVIEEPITENVLREIPEPEPIRQSIYEVPRFSYHEISDAENLLASTRVSVEEPTVSAELVDSTPSPIEVISAGTVEAFTEKVPENAKEEQKPVFEPLRHSYHEIQDAERVLASTKSTEEAKSPKEASQSTVKEITPEPVKPEEKRSTPVEEITSIHVENTLFKIISSQLTTKTKTDTEHTIDFISNESIATEPIHNIQQRVELPSPLQRASLEKIEQSFEVDDLSNTPISVVYGNTDIGTPTLELKVPIYESKAKETVPAEVSESFDKISKLHVDDVTKIEASQDDGSIEEDTFEIIDHSEVSDIVTDENITEPKEIESHISDAASNVTEVSTHVSETVTEITSNQSITTKQPRSVTPKTSDDHAAVQDLIEEALQETESPVTTTTFVTRTKPAYETFVIDDLNESLVPIVFGDIKDIERSIKYKKQELLLQTEPLQPESSEKEIVDEVIFAGGSSSPLEDIEIVETTEDFTIPHPSEYVELDPATDLELDAKPDTISVDTHTEVLQSVINLPEPEIIKQTDALTPTDVKKNNIISADLRETQLTETETVSRVEKSPIHSLHDLLPEIDSIPEFKPSYSNTVLYSNLSADAPEFTPSYMYQTVTTVSERRSDVVEDAPAPITMDEETIRVVTEDTPISYSTVLQTKKEKETMQQTPTPVEKAMDAEVPTEEGHEDHVETKTKKSKKKKKKERDDKREVSIAKPAEVVSLPVTAPSASGVTSVLPEPINVWAKAAEEGKSYADVLAEGLVQEHKEFIQLVTENPKEKEIPEQKKPRKEKVQDIEKVGRTPAVPPVYEIQEVVETTQTVTESDNSIGSWAKIVAKRSSPERVQKDEETQHQSQAPSHVSSKAPVILVDESDNDHHKPDVEVDAEGFITVDRSRRSRSKSREARSQSSVSQKRETREKSENRFEPLTTTLKPDDTESTQSLSEDEKPAKKAGRKSRSSKSKEKEIKPKAIVVAPSTSDEDKQPPKKDKKKRSSKSKDKVIKPVEEKIETPKEVEILEPQNVDDKKENESSLSVQSELKKKTKKKKKDKKPIEVTEATETSSPVEVTSSEQEIVSAPNLLTHSQKKQIYTPVSTPESIETPIKDRVFSEAQFWKIDPGNFSEIISVEIKHTPMETYKIQIKDDMPAEKSLLKPDKPSKSVEPLQSTAKFITEEISSVETEIQELEDTIAEDQSLESKMADLQREIEEMLLPENDSSLSEGSPKELTDTQTSIEYQYDELLDNMTPSLASPEPDGLEPKSVEETVPEEASEDKTSKHDEELDDKHISMSMIDSLLDDTEPLSMTETHSLEHSENLLVTQEEDITPRDFNIPDTKEVTSFAPPEKPKDVSKEVLDKMILETMVNQAMTTVTELKGITTVTKNDRLQDKPTPKIESEKPVPPVFEKPELKEKLDHELPEQVTVFIESQKTTENQVLKSEFTEKITQKSDSLKKSVISFIETEQDKSVPAEVNKAPSGKDKSQDVLKLAEEIITEKDSDPADIVSKVPLSNIDTTTNNLTNLKADNFWTDKHNVHDAELLLIERKSVENTIKLVDTDDPHIDEGISVEENIINDNSFWPEKHLYHDAECQYFLLLARKTKTPINDITEIEIKDQNDKDRDQGGSSGHSSEGEEQKDSSGSPYDPDYISMDLPGGMCSWKDKSSYLSVETPVVDDVVDELVSREDILTTLPIAPAPSSSKQEPEETPLRTTKVTDPQSYCTIFKYLLYVWHDIITKFLISHITKLCIVMYVATPQFVL